MGQALDFARDRDWMHHVYSNLLYCTKGLKVGTQENPGD
jgi:hypothetical protein